MANSSGSSASSALDSVENYVRERYRRERDKIDAMYTKRDVEKAHSQYIQSNSSPYQLAESIQARAEAQSWANRHGLKQQPPLRARRRLPNTKATSTVTRATTQKQSTRTATSTTITPQPVVTRPPTSPSPPSLEDTPLGAALAVSPPCLLDFQLPAWDGFRLSEPEPVSMETHSCPVLMCGATFSSRDNLDNHLTQYEEHNPCHPYKHLTDMEFHWNVKEYRCTVCYKAFKTDRDCLAHMMAREHRLLELYKPVQIVAFACPQCFKIYPTAAECRLHIAEDDHTTYKFPFKGDPKVAGPLPVPSSIMQQFIEACSESPWHLECVECRYQLHPEEGVGSHLDPQHNLLAISQQSLSDVFARFQKAYTCVMCNIVFSSLPPSGISSYHQCDDKTMGIIIKNNCDQSVHYMVRLALMRPASLKPEFPSNAEVDGPGSVEEEGNARSTPVTPSTNDDSVIVLEDDPRATPHLHPLKVIESIIDLTSPAVVAGIEENSQRRTLPDDDTVMASSEERKRKTLDHNEDQLERKRLRMTTPKRKKKKSGNGKDNQINYLDTQMEHLRSDALVRKSVEPVQLEAIVKKTATLCVKSDHDMSSKELRLTKPSATHSKKSDIVLSAPSDFNFRGKAATNSSAVKKFNGATSSSKGDQIPQNLDKMKHILFLDLDNWPKFFQKLPQSLCEGTFVWAFIGGKTVWKEPRCLSYETALRRKAFYLHGRCGTTKDAADFAMALYIGKMDERLPKTIPFSVLSGDKGFHELERQMEDSERHAVVINPHHRTEEEVLVLLYSVTQTTENSN